MVIFFYIKERKINIIVGQEVILSLELLKTSLIIVFLYMSIVEILKNTEDVEKKNAIICNSTAWKESLLILFFLHNW